MIACPRCGRSVPEKRSSCIYCGARLSIAPTALLGMTAGQWVEEGIRVASLRQWERAVSCFDKALQLEPKNAVVHFDKALVLVDAQRPEQALAVALEAQRLAPDDAEIVALVERLRSPSAPPPVGRPGPALGDDEQSQWIVRGTALLHEKLGLFAGPQAIAATNWLVDVPHGSSWSSSAQGSLLCHVILGDRTAYLFRHAVGSLDDDALPQDDFEAAGALLESGTLRRVVFCGNRPFALTVFARVNEINERLAAMGVGSERHVELLRIDPA